MDKPEVLKVLQSTRVRATDLNSGPMMLRECLNHQQLVKIFWRAVFAGPVGYSDSPTFDLASDAFATLRMSLTVHKLLV